MPISTEDSQATDAVRIERSNMQMLQASVALPGDDSSASDQDLEAENS